MGSFVQEQEALKRELDAKDQAQVSLHNEPKKSIENNGLYLSIVIPLFNEEANVSALVEAIEKEVIPLSKTFELVLVDDGSSDATWHSVEALSQTKPFIKGVKLARNFGHQHALLAGLSKAEGQAIISMDGDLQHPPSLIKDLIAQHQAGYKVVNTQRHDQAVASTFKRKSSAYFYKVFSALTDVQMSEGMSDFRLLDRSALDELLKFQDVDLFLRGAVEWLGFESITIAYQAAARHAGESKYTLSKMLKFAKGSIISFSTKPLILSVWLGVFTSLWAFAELGYIVYQAWSGQTVPGWASITGIMSLLFGVLFIILGIMGTYLARIHVALQNRPRFIIQEVVKNQEDLRKA